MIKPLSRPWKRYNTMLISRLILIPSYWIMTYNNSRCTLTKATRNHRTLVPSLFRRHPLQFVVITLIRVRVAHRNSLKRHTRRNRREVVRRTLVLNRPATYLLSRRRYLDHSHLLLMIARSPLTDHPYFTQMHTLPLVHRRHFRQRLPHQPRLPLSFGTLVTDPYNLYLVNIRCPMEAKRNNALQSRRLPPSPLPSQGRHLSSLPLTNKLTLLRNGFIAMKTGPKQETLTLYWS